MSYGTLLEIILGHQDPSEIKELIADCIKIMTVGRESLIQLWEETTDFILTLPDDYLSEYRDEVEKLLIFSSLITNRGSWRYGIRVDIGNKVYAISDSGSFYDTTSMIDNLIGPELEQDLLLTNRELIISRIVLFADLSEKKLKRELAKVKKLFYMFEQEKHAAYYKRLNLIDNLQF